MSILVTVGAVIILFCGLCLAASLNLAEAECDTLVDKWYFIVATVFTVLLMVAAVITLVVCIGKGIGELG